MQNLFLALTLFVSIHQASAQLPVINSFSQNGLLVCTNLQSNTVAAVEWASSLAGPWQTNWAGLDTVAVSSNGTISVSVPMFYRVRGVANTNANIQFTGDGMALIPAGTFTMGDALDGEADAIPTVSVMVSAFYMDTNLVNYGQWQSIYAYATNHSYTFDNSAYGKATNYPVGNLNWYDAVKWCNARSQQAGLTPVYYNDAGLTQVYTTGDTDAVYVNWTTNGYRLPTEAEWEKAARGGLTGQRFPWGDTISWSQANYQGDPLSLDPSYGYAYDLATAIDFDPAFSGGDGPYPYTSPVGSLAPNGYGLYDMAGNLFEWCWDWSATPYAGGNDPHGPASSTGVRMFRGGCWYNYASIARCAYRGGTHPSEVGYNSVIGFRCVRRH